MYPSSSVFYFFLIRPTSVSVLLLSPYKPCIRPLQSPVFYFFLIRPTSVSVLLLSPYEPCIRPLQSPVFYFFLIRSTSVSVLLFSPYKLRIRVLFFTSPWFFLLMFPNNPCKGHCPYPYFSFILSPPLGASWMTGTSLVRWEWKCFGWLDSLRRDIKLYLHLYMVNYPNFNPLFL